MQYPHYPKKYSIIKLVSMLLTVTCLQAWADDGSKTKPLVLRKIMQDMGKNMQAITDGISREDWEAVARAAPLIADHPQPPLTEKMRILSFVGSDAGKFKSHDEKMKRVARTLQDAALRDDGEAVIASFATLQSSCLICHQSFRKPFLEHFYMRR
ncbi:cytochrome c [Thauera chlorobenzoica]|uniref:Cytochrome C domain protein n=1 Tax=Thauera chlorobenzoica TaxID=96773 RepID=A0A1H5T383_9RHOO|nr:cytochrome c [Thauera chlorobenzoica]APR04161.1 cytochrome C domain protein [Thauera chlorobenzoica]SEF57263.1 Cytochrome c556 [Thauera chlorobenzoica]